MGLLRPSLPLYPPHEIVGRNAMRSLDGTENGSFVRQVTISEHMKPLLRWGIRGFIERIDAEFEAVARFCGAVVIPHEWGITRHQEARSPRRRQTGPPNRHLIQPHRGYDLAAKVARVNPKPAPEGWHDQVVAGLDRYAGTTRDYFYSDRKTDQFLYGTITDDPEHLTWLVDIDALFFPEKRHRLHYPVRGDGGSI